jgi:hypothetical protein
MLSKQEEDLERREVFENDRKLREAEQRAKDQSGTFLSHTHIDDAGGRFTAVNAATVIGSGPGVAAAYPAASAAHQTALPDEPLTGYRIDEMPVES